MSVLPARRPPVHHREERSLSRGLRHSSAAGSRARAGPGRRCGLRPTPRRRSRPPPRHRVSSRTRGRWPRRAAPTAAPQGPRGPGQRRRRRRAGSRSRIPRGRSGAARPSSRWRQFRTGWPSRHTRLEAGYADEPCTAGPGDPLREGHADAQAGERARTADDGDELRRADVPAEFPGGIAQCRRHEPGMRAGNRQGPLDGQAGAGGGDRAGCQAGVDGQCAHTIALVMRPELLDPPSRRTYAQRGACVSVHRAFITIQHPRPACKRVAIT